MVDATVNALIAEAVNTARTSAKLTRAQLAKRIGTKPSLVSQLEDGRYEPRLFCMLHRIAEALGKRLEIRLVDVKRQKSA